MRSSEMVTNSNVYVFCPVKGEDYVQSIDVDPVQEIAEVTIGLKTIATRVHGFEGIAPCHGVVSVRFDSKKWRKVTVTFGKMLPCSTGSDACEQTTRDMAVIGRSA